MLMNLIRFSFIALLLCNSAMASDFDQKINSMADNMNKFRKVSNVYSINVDNNEDMASTIVWQRQRLQCKISVNEEIAKYHKMSDDTLAWFIGHELGHCELKHSQYRTGARLSSDLWKEEYDADIIGKQLMTSAGYDFRVVFSELLTKNILDIAPEATHPDRDSRLANMSTPNQIRVYPKLIK